jgi:DNA-binding transcriptional LysR family regulator
MLSEHVIVETGDTKLSRRFSSAVQGHLRSLEKDEAKKSPNYIKVESAHLRMIDLNLFRAFDAMMLRVGATNYPCMVVLPSLVKRLAKSAPNVDLRVLPSDHIELVQRLEKRRADLVIGSFTEVPAGIRRTRLLREDDVITIRTGHPLTRGRMTKERLLEFPHVVVDPAGTRESVTDGFSDEARDGKRVSVERALYEFQNGRIVPDGRAAVCVPNFAAVAPFLELSDMVAMLPRRLALWAAAHAPSRCSIRPTGRLP